MIRTQEPEFILALEKLHGKLGRAQQQQMPLTKDILEKLIAACGEDLVGVMNKVMLQLGLRDHVSTFRGIPI